MRTSQPSKYKAGDVVRARGETWRIIDRSDDEAQQVWAVLVKDPDQDAILHFREIGESEDEQRQLAAK